MTNFSYNGDNLSQINWADGSGQKFVYENIQYPWAVTGIFDLANPSDQGTRYATYGYDTNGYANSSTLSGGADSYSSSYVSGPLQTVILNYDATAGIAWLDHYLNAPVGATLTGPSSSASYGATPVNGFARMTSATQAAGAGCAASQSAVAYDSAGNVVSEDDFNGNRVCYGYDATRNLRTQTLEGLAATKACPAVLSTYAPNQMNPMHPERKTTTVWHPDWELKQQEASPKKITTWVYNGQIDPITTNYVYCTPNSALRLPDGKQVAALCTRYEQATTDSSGALGIAATVTGATRTWRYTYDQFGQVLTETVPGQSATDSPSHTTTYVYYTDTNITSNAGHTIGDLHTKTNSLGQVTTYTSYDGAGRVLSSTDANGAVITQTYTPRGWLQTQTVTATSGDSLTTTYAYWPTGLIRTVTLPDGSTLNYVYDDAHRLTDVVDAAGNKVHYVLDSSGNRTSEQLSDASGNLASTVARVFDALNRMQTQTGIAH